MKIKLLFSSMVAVVLSAAAFAQESTVISKDQQNGRGQKNEQELKNVRGSELNPVESNAPAVDDHFTKDPNYSPIDLPGFPVYVNTGSPERDAASYQKAKEEWVKSNNPNSYNLLIKSESETKVERNTSGAEENSIEKKKIDGHLVLSLEEFNALPKEKQDYLLANPEQYIIK